MDEARAPRVEFEREAEVEGVAGGRELGASAGGGPSMSTSSTRGEKISRLAPRGVSTFSTITTLLACSG